MNRAVAEQLVWEGGCGRAFRPDAFRSGRRDLKKQHRA
ncbi:hypothetical protein GLE_3981 [Lysobacter enzymogenes]|uniref:Uncharacterized protein n=1 Tax=Lysobacter enzymogenes TaxID=69 RepID=A0A0S2DKY1_LYSEN|nr:hypothetical protein GLE_3981 [Lysobacter enzymogenes]